MSGKPLSGKSLSERIGDLGHRLAIEAHAAWLAARDPRVPMLARALAVAVAAYALSPIDLIPDFIPVLGWLDDLVIVPLGLLIVRRLIPAALWTELHAAAETASERPSSRAGMAFILLLWAGLLYIVYWGVRTSPWH
ncbi:YkvA family protein [Sphingopyxis sp.]|uniref:YkvA family protein n=1 Tax=Sphingopyxis sp. TaxID=1908224 RepID=UPI002D792775|nr:YkvA family protein [Sphingopyxis sp.]HET6524292.1 YkvA family protein [Sphingopyxis sp.]